MPYMWLASARLTRMQWRWSFARQHVVARKPALMGHRQLTLVVNESRLDRQAHQVAFGRWAPAWLAWPTPVQGQALIFAADGGTRLVLAIRGCAALKVDPVMRGFITYLNNPSLCASKAASARELTFSLR